MITGFRLSLGGAQAYYGVKPDLTTLGKIVGGGMPMAAYGGRRDIMEMVAPVGGVYQAGTLSGNPVATAAGLETLRMLQEDPEIYQRLDEKTAILAKTVKEAFGDSVCVNRLGSLMCVFFREGGVTDYETALQSDTNRYAAYFNEMLEHGIYLAPSQYEAMFVSDAHTKEEIEQTCEVIRSLGRE